MKTVTTSDEGHSICGNSVRLPPGRIGITLPMQALSARKSLMACSRTRPRELRAVILAVRLRDVIMIGGSTKPTWQGTSDQNRTEMIRAVYDIDKGKMSNRRAAEKGVADSKQNCNIDKKKTTSERYNSKVSPSNEYISQDTRRWTS